MENFTAIRNGLLEHIRQGKLSPRDLGVYVFLHLTADWATGVCYTNARAIAAQFADSISAKEARQTLYRLRQKQYINYREGDGSRGSYNVLLHKCRPTVGGHVGKQLNAFAEGSLDIPVYEPHNSQETVKRQSANSQETVRSPLQDLKTLQDDKKTRWENNRASFKPFNKAEQRQADNLKAREAAIAAIMADQSTDDSC